MDSNEQRAILTEIARDKRTSATARVTALRTLAEMDAEEGPELRALPGGLAEIAPGRYRKPRPGA
jgi:hypothetical protein